MTQTLTGNPNEKQLELPLEDPNVPDSDEGALGL